MNKHTPLFVLAFFVVLAMILTACGSSPPPEETKPSPPAEPSPPPKEQPPPPPPPDKPPELPASPPMLSIETDMHEATINRMARDAEFRYLVTASDDKTVRVWDMKTAELLSTLRPFSDTGSEGRIYTVAISPNGEAIACGGWTKAGSDTHNIYVFNRQDGALVYRIAGLPNAVNHLEFSDNGQYLAAAMGGNNGLRIYNGLSFEEIAQDTDYGNSSYWLDFDSRDRLVSSSYDGFIRLYNVGNSVDTDNSTEPVNLKPVYKKRAPGGKQPFVVTFSPDGSRIAVGFTDNTAINVLSDKDLALLYSPRTDGKDNGGHGIVAWSPDAQFLFAGGRNAIDGFIPVFRWADEGRGAREEWPGPKDIITQIMGLPNGAAIYVSADPAVGVFSSLGKQVFFRSADIPNFRGSRNALLLSQDGKTVHFGYKYGGTEPARFSVANLELLIPAPVQAVDSGDSPPSTDIPESADTAETSESIGTLAPPDVESLKVDGWKNGLTPEINGSALRLKPYERSRSFAIAPDKKSFLIGTQWQLRHYASDGKALWSIPIPGEAWAVNISGDGKLAVAALGDGTIRWYQMSDGTALLSLFPHGDRNRWILWTPNGNYASSPDADSLIGWRINNGPDAAADFFPVSQFAEKFHLPEMVSAALDVVHKESAEL